MLIAATYFVGIDYLLGVLNISLEYAKKFQLVVIINATVLETINPIKGEKINTKVIVKIKFTSTSKP